MLNDFTLTEYCNDIAQDICRDASDEDQAMDWATESADGSEYVIYYAKAHDLCRGCNTDAGEDFVAECWVDTVMSYTPFYIAKLLYVHSTATSTECNRVQQVNHD